MSIDSMRVGGGRCPPLLVGGLLIVCLMLVINWYTLSSENLELLRQLDELGDQLRISAEERDQCVTMRGNLEQRLKHSDDEVAHLHVRIAQQKGEVEMSVTACKTELESLKEVDRIKSATLEALRLDKERIFTQLDVKRDENKKLQEDVDKLKSDLENAKLTISTADENKKTVEIVPQAQTNTKLKNSAQNVADPNLQQEADEFKDAMGNIAVGNPLEEENVVEDEDRANEDQKESQPKLATDDLAKSADLNM